MKSGWEKQKEEEVKEEAEKKKEEKEKKKKQKKERIVKVRKIVEEWEIWDKEEEAAKSEVEARRLVPEKFHRWIKVFGKKQSELFFRFMLALANLLLEGLTLD